jgi:hypothetical protein
MRSAALHVGVASVAVAYAIACSHAVDAQAYDLSPRAAKLEQVTWTADLVQLCPVTGMVNGRIPVYAHPLRHDKGTGGPRVQSWLTPTDETIDGQRAKALKYRCQRQFPNAQYFHPNGAWVNNWWALAQGSDNQPGWVPEVYFKGGDNDEADLRLRKCEGAPAPPSPPPSTPPCEPTPAVAGVRLSAHFKHLRSVASPRYGQRPRVSGALTDASGAPMPGATVCIGVQDRAAAPVTAIRSITTDDAGRFAYRIPVGATRRVWFVHRIGGGAASASVDVHVRAPVTLRSSRRSLRNGEATRFRGRVGGMADTSGLLVELQYPHGGWQTFATARRPLPLPLPVHAHARNAHIPAASARAHSARLSVRRGRVANRAGARARLRHGISGFLETLAGVRSSADPERHEPHM